MHLHSRSHSHPHPHRRLELKCICWDRLPLHEHYVSQHVSIVAQTQESHDLSARQLSTIGIIAVITVKIIMKAIKKLSKLHFGMHTLDMHV
jgi:hypothetical protein